MDAGADMFLNGDFSANIAWDSLIPDEAMTFVDQREQELRRRGRDPSSTACHGSGLFPAVH